MDVNLNLTPDGVRYLAMAEGQSVPYPFMYRWLVPWIIGRKASQWPQQRVFLVLSLAAIGAWAYNMYDAAWPQAFATIGIAVGLSGFWRYNWHHPVLVDGTAMCFALVCAISAWRGDGLALVACLALLAGATKETAPIFAALWAWSPWPLIGLAAPLLRHALARGGQEPEGVPAAAIEAVLHPLRTSWSTHKRFFQEDGWGVWFAPWGACLLAVANPIHVLQLVVTVVISYAQCIVATDTARLYMWAWPVVVLQTVGAVPPAWLPALVLIHWAFVSVTNWNGL